MEMLNPRIIATLGLGFVVALIAALLVTIVIGSKHAYGLHTNGQVGLALALCVVFAAWAAVEIAIWVRDRFSLQTDFRKVPTEDEVELGKVEASVVGRPDEKSAVANEESTASTGPDIVERGSPQTDGVPVEAQGGTSGGKLPGSAGTTGSESLTLTALVTPLRAGAELAAILAFVYVCDRTEIVPKGKKVYNPSVFWGLCGLLLLAALCTCRQTKHAKPLQREQSDEWKGWMQIMFLMYHYFAEKEIYNAIRIYIAAYVWMTGYGNFCYYARKGDFSSKRLMHMLFRLNFMGFCICALLNNEYMLYYICAMHTLFTVFVVVALYLWKKYNASVRHVYTKLVVLIVLVVVLYDGPPLIFRSVFGTLPGVRPLLAFHDPLHPEFKDEMHEWHFRSGLDRFIWVIGMFFALHIKHYEEWIESVELMPLGKRTVMYFAQISGVLVVGSLWWYFVFRHDKYTYNGMHPFTSFIPIACYLCLRNVVPALRRRYLYLFAYMGKYTLETYIFQFHIWMKTTGLNGSPKFLLVLIPGYYYLNMVVCTGIYVILSIRFFHVTATISDALVPSKARDQAIVLCILGTACLIFWVLGGMSPSIQA